LDILTPENIQQAILTIENETSVLLKTAENKYPIMWSDTQEEWPP
jgi:hypothetical protein